MSICLQNLRQSAHAQCNALAVGEGRQRQQWLQQTAAGPAENARGKWLG